MRLMKEEIERYRLDLREAVSDHFPSLSDPTREVHWAKIDAICDQALSLESVRSAVLEEALQKRENEIWEEVIESCLQAWPGEKVFYNQSPIELIIRLINERDEALQSPAGMAEGWQECAECGMLEKCARMKACQLSTASEAVHSTELRK